MQLYKKYYFSRLALLHSRQTFLRSYTIAKDCINKNTYNLFDGKDEHSIANAENS
jgi:hypothetical protein